jgi:hypothetical protein
MTTWTLIFAVAMGWREGVIFTIPNLVSYEECIRVEKIVRKEFFVTGYNADAPSKGLCIEAHTAK